MKMLYLDDDVVEDLKKVNASQLTNGLLKEYFRKTHLATMTDEELDKRMKYLETKERHKKELEAIQNG